MYCSGSYIVICCMSCDLSKIYLKCLYLMTSIKREMKYIICGIFIISSFALSYSYVVNLVVCLPISSLMCNA